MSPTDMNTAATEKMSRSGGGQTVTSIFIDKDITLEGEKTVAQGDLTRITTINDAIVTLSDDVTVLFERDGFQIIGLNVLGAHTLTFEGLRSISELYGTMETLALTNTSHASTTLSGGTFSAQITADANTSLVLSTVDVTGGVAATRSFILNSSTLAGTVSFAARDPGDDMPATPDGFGARPSVWGSVYSSAIVAGADGVAITGSAQSDGLQITGGSTVSGRVMMGDGDDHFYVLNAHTTGQLLMGDGNDQVLLAMDTTNFASHTGLINLGAGTDLFKGNASDSMVEGGAGADILFGGDGIDRLVYRSSDASVHVRLGSQYAFGGHATGDVFNGFENAFGSHLNDVLIGSAGRNVLHGFHGDDYLRGGLGRDVLIGGRGADTFVFRAGDAGTTNMTRDLIRDFSTAEGDKIDLHNTATHFAGDAFTGTAGEAIQIGERLLIDIDGDGHADMRIDVLGDRLDAESFIF